MSNIKGKRYEVCVVWRGYGKLDDLFEIGDIVVALENNSFKNIGFLNIFL